jgi:hypothetical protein
VTDDILVKELIHDISTKVENMLKLFLREAACGIQCCCLKSNLSRVYVHASGRRRNFISSHGDHLLHDQKNPLLVQRLVRKTVFLLKGRTRKMLNLPRRNQCRFNERLGWNIKKLLFH